VVLEKFPKAGRIVPELIALQEKENQKDFASGKFYAFIR
jgi:hypothetical protein